MVDSQSHRAPDEKGFYQSKNIFIGKSFIEKKKNVGGQNPIEAAKLGCKIFHGPYVYNFQEVYEHLESFGVSKKINNEIELANKIIKNFELLFIKDEKNINLLNEYGEKILKETAREINKYLI